MCAIVYVCVCICGFNTEEKIHWVFIYNMICYVYFNIDIFK